MRDDDRVRVLLVTNVSALETSEYVLSISEVWVMRVAVG